MADVDIEHDRVAVVMLALDQVIEIRPNRVQRFRQRLALFYRINGQIKCGNARVAETIDYIRLHQAAIGWQVNENISLSTVVDDLVDKLWPQQRFATHQGQNACAD